MDAGNKYADIIDLPHHVSKTRAPMPIEDRAAQFGSFDALAGFAAVIEDIGRKTGDEHRKEDGSRDISDGGTPKTL